MFHFVPFYAMSIYGLICPGQYWMLDWSLFFAGAAAQVRILCLGHCFLFQNIQPPRQGKSESPVPNYGQFDSYRHNSHTLEVPCIIVLRTS